MAHGSQVIDFIRLYFLYNPDQVRAVGQITIMQYQVTVRDMRVFVKMIDPLGIEQGTPAFNSMHFIAFLQQQFRQISSVLPRNPCN